MERLASAYNDKLVVPLKDHKAPGFVKNFRKQVKRIAKNIKGKKNSPGKQASFDDFLVAKVINGHETADEYGRHWGPYYKMCSPCKVSYDYIGLLDPTMEETKVCGNLKKTTQT